MQNYNMQWRVQHTPLLAPPNAHVPHANAPHTSALQRLQQQHAQQQQLQQQLKLQSVPPAAVCCAALHFDLSIKGKVYL